MSNTFTQQVINDGCRNVQVKIDGFLDSSDAVLVPALDLTSLINNDKNLTLVGIRIDELEFSISPDLVVSLFWEAASPQSIARMAGSYTLHFDGGLFPDRTALNYRGNLLLSTSGWQAGKPEAFSLILWGVKLYT